MKKKVIIGIIAVVIIIAIIVFVVYKNNNTIKAKISSDSKILVVYYSAQNHTEAVAQKIAENLGADTFEIVPKEVYTSDDLDWTDSNSRVSKEHNDTSLRNIELETTDVPNWEDYDTVLIGYPIWWETGIYVRQAEKVA